MRFVHTYKEGLRPCQQSKTKPSTAAQDTLTRCAGESQQQQVQHQPIVLGDEGGKLQAADDAV